MKASTQRKIWRWVHIILSVPIVGFVYGPVSKIPRAAFAVRWVFFPIVVLSGLWMWKGHVVKRWMKNKITSGSLLKRLQNVQVSDTTKA